MVLEQDIEALEFTDIPFREDSWVTLFIGPRGSGKSLTAAHFVNIIAKRKNRKVFYFPASLRLTIGEPISISELATFAELDTDEPTKIDGAIVYIDEIHLVMNKFRTNTWGNRMVQAFLSQIRKRGCDLYGTTNSPNQVDEALIETVDFHGVCKKYTDMRCKTASIAANLDGIRHLVDCKDAINIRMADTQRRFGKSRRYMDGVRRKWITITGIVNKYGKLYNTDAVVSAIEISQLSKDSIKDAAETAKTGHDFSAFVVQMQQEIIPAIVEAGGEWLHPNMFVATLKEQFSLDISKERIGKACRELGLENKRGSQGARYKLPTKEKLSLFVSGVG